MPVPTRRPGRGDRDALRLVREAGGVSGWCLQIEFDRVNQRPLNELLTALGYAGHPDSPPVVGVELVHDFDLVTRLGQPATIHVADVDASPLGCGEHHIENTALGHGRGR
jgi:hypothetical protein